MMLYHFTFCENLPFIRRDGVLLPTATLRDNCGLGDEKTQKRDCHRELPCGRISRDQSALTDGLVFSDDTNLDKFASYLDEHVFFWPDRFTDKRYRERFRAKYQRSECVGLRVCFADLREANPGTEFLYSPYNSGAVPREPEKYKRSHSLFQPLQSRGGERLVEIVVRGKIRLPENTEMEGDNGKWGLFF